MCFCSDVKERTTRSFSVSGVFNYTTLHLSKEDNMLYVGAREILFALNLTDISAVKLQRNVRARRLQRYECSYNRIPDVQYEYGCKYDMTPEVQCEYNPPQCYYTFSVSPTVFLSCSSRGKLQRGRETNAVSKAKTCRQVNCWCKSSSN